MRIHSIVATRNSQRQRRMRFWAVAIVIACLLPASTSASIGVVHRRELNDNDQANGGDSNKSSNTNAQDGNRKNRNNGNGGNDGNGNGDNDNDNRKNNKSNNGNGNGTGNDNKNRNSNNEGNNIDWSTVSSSNQTDIEAELEKEAFLNSNTTEWHKITYDDDTVSGWQEMEAATVTPTIAPIVTWESDKPSSFPTSDASTEVTDEPTAAGSTTEAVSSTPTTASPTTESSTQIPESTGAPVASSGANKFLSFAGNQQTNQTQQQQSQFITSFGASSTSATPTTAAPTTAAPTVAPIPSPTATSQQTASFFGFLSPPTYSAQGTATAEDAANATVLKTSSSSSNTNEFFETSESSSGYFHVAQPTSSPVVSTDPAATSGYTEQGDSSPEYAPGVYSYPIADSIQDASHLFDQSNHYQAGQAAPESSYPVGDVANVEMLNMTNVEAVDGTGGGYGYQAEGGEDSYVEHPYYSMPTEESNFMSGSGYNPNDASADIPDWDPSPEAYASMSMPQHISSKGGKVGKDVKGSKGGRHGSASSYDAAMKCIEDQKAAKEKGHGDDKMKKCPDVNASKGGARRKIQMPKPGYPQPTYPQPISFHFPSPTIMHPQAPSPVSAPISAPVSAPATQSRPTFFRPVQQSPVAPSASIVTPTLATSSAVPTPSPIVRSPAASEPPTTESSPAANAPTPSFVATDAPSVGASFPTVEQQPSAFTAFPVIADIPTTTPDSETEEPPSAGFPTAATQTTGPSVSFPSAAAPSAEPVIAFPTSENNDAATAEPVEPTPASDNFPTALPALTDGVDTQRPTPSNGAAVTSLPTVLLEVEPNTTSSEGVGPSQPVEVSQLNEVWVAAKDVTVEAKGSIDLSTAQQEVFNQTVSVMTPFFEAYFGDNLVKFQLGLTFLESKTDSVSLGDSGSEAAVQSYFVAEVSFLVSSADMDVLIDFDQKKATDVVEMFYQGDSRDVLLKLLYGKGIEVDTLEVYEGELDESSGSPAPTSFPTKDPELSTEQEPEATEATETKSTNAALYAGVVSGGVILVAIGAVIYTTRNSERNFFKDALESVSDSLYNDSLGGPPGGKLLPVLSPRASATARTGRSSMASSETRSRIKPAAITLRKKAKAAQESAGSVSTLGSMRLHKNGQESRSPPINENEAEDYDRLHRMENGPDLIASRVLTYHDPDVQGVVNSYPEFDIYHQANPYADTAWSVDGLTLEDENEVGRHRRWQDESSETGISGLPDHHSSTNGSTKS
ncbi:hypothetical protein MPSEU_000845900 [Mayamaea pseudoterrestris]|nr:hypothetical protein MPSEU_000845900 [Mayamaea pseudoterrestris]